MMEVSENESIPIRKSSSCLQENPQRLDARHLLASKADEDIVPSAWRHAGQPGGDQIFGDPLERRFVPTQVKIIERNSLSGKFRPARMA